MAKKITFFALSGAFTARGNNVCTKHNYSSKNGGLCPICRQPLKRLGVRFRLSRDAQIKIRPNRKRPAQVS